MTRWRAPLALLANLALIVMATLARVSGREPRRTPTDSHDAARAQVSFHTGTPLADPPAQLGSGALGSLGRPAPTIPILEPGSAAPKAAPPRRPRGRLGALAAHLRAPAVCLLYMLVLIGVSIGVDRVIVTRLFQQPYDYVPAYRSFQEYAVGAKLNQFRAEEKRHWSAFFVGNSRTEFGVNPAVFDAKLSTRSSTFKGFSAYNLAEPSVDVRFWQPFFTRYYAKPPPKYLFLGILPRDLDSSYTLGESYLQEFLASAGFQNRNMSAINRWAEEALAHLYILHGRISDIRLVTLSDILHGRKLNLEEIHVVNTEGWSRLPPGVQETVNQLEAQAKVLAHRHGNTPFQLGAQQKRSLVALNSWVRRGGGCLILYTTPLFFDREPWGTEEMRQGFTKTVHQLVREIPGLQFVDVGAHVQGSYSARDYGDGDHLNATGATRFSAQLAQALQPAMQASACHGVA